MCNNINEKKKPLLHLQKEQQEYLICHQVPTLCKQLWEKFKVPAIRFSPRPTLPEST